MKIYSGTLTESQVYNALKAGKDRGIVAPLVFFDRLRPFKARDGRNGFDVVLQADDYDGRGRRRNTGYSGASDNYAATYDEWGHFIFALYELDEQAQVGQYANRDDFNFQTGDSYDLAMFALDFAAFNQDPYPFVTGSVSNGRSGRVGAGRNDGESWWIQRSADAAVEWYEAGHTTQKQGLGVRYAPRTVDEVAAFCGRSIDKLQGGPDK